ncbi:unnamed protein product [Prorocentrum cordatum]|uniref:Uncharacterized protein n=1 Tax=Prorocentrum cordatum TaxID=2364126 RepID=A0ABN9WFU8_9DINO|nr:unnamed protein product [Polarella glacialis]
MYTRSTLSSAPGIVVRDEGDEEAEGLVIGGAAAGLAAKSDTNTGDRLRGVGEKVVKVGGEAFESRKDTPVGQKAVDAGVEDGLAWTADKVDGVISSIYNVFKKVPADDDKKLDE